MSLNKLQIKRQPKRNSEVYHITLPKQLVEEIARWSPGQQLEIVWVEKGKHEPFNKGYFRISRPTSLWEDKKQEPE